MKELINKRIHSAPEVGAQTEAKGYPARTNYPLQRKQDEARPVLQTKPNATGLPDNVKSNIESMSGVGLDDVRVHYNSSKPSQLQAHAYAQGTDIHVAPGQQKHVAHEAWHVEQQKQGRVKATTSYNGVAINDDRKLEREADDMGAKAMQ